jgi:hypothetical protein
MPPEVYGAIGVPIDEGSAMRSDADVVVVVGCVEVVDDDAALAGCEPPMTLIATAAATPAASRYLMPHPLTVRKASSVYQVAESFVTHSPFARMASLRHQTPNRTPS